MGRSLVFVGDSLTEWFDWQRRFPEYEVMNFGVAGEPVEGLLYRMDRILLGLQRPDVIFIMTGINNIAMEDYEITNTYRQIVNRFFSVFTKSVIVVQSILPVELSWVDNKHIRAQNESLKGIAKNFMAEYLDVYGLFIDSDGNTISEYLLEDGVHVSDKGYEVWSKAVEAFLKSFNSKPV